MIIKHAAAFIWMKYSHFTVLLITAFVFASLLTPLAVAETIQLKDGNTLTGNIKTSEGEFVEVETKYGLLKIKKDEILSSDSNTPQSPSKQNNLLLPSNTDSSKFAVGVAYTGGGIRYDFDKRRSWEIRYLVGNEKNSNGDISSDVIGLRSYRFFPDSNSFKVFTGSELAYFTGKQKGTSYAASGVALGFFGGIELPVKKAITFGVDIGPYMLWLRESESHKTESSLEFVANAFVNFYLF